MKHIISTLTFSFLFGCVPFVPVVQAADDAPTPPHRHWHQADVLGTYDKASLQRGFQVYKEVCSACHGLKRVAYRTFKPSFVTKGAVSK